MVLSQRIVPFVLLLTGSLVYADIPLPSPESTEVTLEGEVSALDGLSQQLTLRAQSFTLPNGRSSSISPTKIKKVVLTKARFLDARTGKSFKLSDLQLSQTVRVVGKSSSVNGTFQARVISWKSALPPASAPPIPSESDEGVALPAVAPLLPPSQSFNRLNLRVVDAGFAAPANFISENDTWSRTNKWTGFYFTYRASSRQGTRPHELVRFSGLYGPGNVPLTQSASTPFVTSILTPIFGHTFFFRQVDPTWKSVRAEFEVQDPNLPSSMSGQEQTAVTFSDIALPISDPSNPGKEVEAKPNLIYTSPRGVKYTLSSIVSEGSSGYRLTWDYLPPAGLEDLKAKIQMFRVTEGGSGTGGAGSSNEVWDKKAFTVFVWNVKKDAKKIGVSFRLVEQSRSWRVASAFKRISFDIPVKPAADATPIAPREAPVAPFEVKGRNVALRWEMEGNNWSGFENTLWLRDTATTRDTEKLPWKWLPREVKAFGPDGKEIGRQWLGERDANYAFRSDNTFHVPNEVSATQFISFESSDTRPPHIEVRLKVERAQVVNFFHRFENVPLPSPGQSREFSPDEFADETLALRRITWIRKPDDVPEAMRERFRDLKKEVLVITFDRTRVFADGDFNSNLYQIRDDTGQRQPEDYSTFDGDPMGKRSEKSSKWTLQITPPFSGSKSMGLLLNTGEIKWSGQPETLIIPNIPVPPRPN